MASAVSGRIGCCPVGCRPGCRNRAYPGSASVGDEPDSGRSAASAPAASATTSSCRAAVRHQPGTGCPAGRSAFGHRTPGTGCPTGRTSVRHQPGTGCFAPLGHEPCTRCSSTAGTGCFAPLGHSTVRAAVRHQPGTGCFAPLGHEPGTRCLTGRSAFGDRTAGTGAECCPIVTSFSSTAGAAFGYRPSGTGCFAPLSHGTGCPTGRTAFPRRSGTGCFAPLGHESGTAAECRPIGTG